MSDVYRMLLGLHVVVAAIALLTFWGAVLSRKGGHLHRRCGRGFALSMGATAASAGVLCGFLLLDPLGARPPGPEIAPTDQVAYARILREIGGGLLELSLATGALLYFGLRALHRRRSVPPRSRDWIVAFAAILAGVAMLTLGFDPRLPYLKGNGIFVGVVGALEVRALFRTGRSRSAWLVQHLVGMLGAGAIAHGAFVTNLVGLFTDDIGTAFGWGGLTGLVFGVAIAWTARRWRRRFEDVRGGQNPILPALVPGSLGGASA